MLVSTCDSPRKSTAPSRGGWTSARAIPAILVELGDWVAQRDLVAVEPVERRSSPWKRRAMAARRTVTERGAHQASKPGDAWTDDRGETPAIRPSRDASTGKRARTSSPSDSAAVAAVTPMAVAEGCADSTTVVLTRIWRRRRLALARHVRHSTYPRGMQWTATPSQNWLLNSRRRRARVA